MPGLVLTGGFTSRYTVLFIPVMIILLGLALIFLSKKIILLPLYFLIILIYLSIHIGNLPPKDYPYNGFKHRFLINRSAGGYLQKFTDEGKKVISSDNDMSFYMGMEHIQLPYKVKLKSLLEYADKNGAEYLVLNSYFDPKPHRSMLTLYGTEETAAMELIEVLQRKNFNIWFDQKKQVFPDSVRKKLFRDMTKGKIILYKINK